MSQRKRKMKDCDKCGKQVSSAHFTRHRRSCKGVLVDGKRPCEKCGVFFRTDKLPRHLEICTGIHDKYALLQQKLLDKQEKIERLMEENKQQVERIHKLELEVTKQTTTTINVVNNIILNALTPIEYDDPKVLEEVTNLMNDALLQNKGFSHIYVDYMKNKAIVTDLARKKVISKNYNGDTVVDVGFNMGRDLYIIAAKRARGADNIPWEEYERNVRLTDMVRPSVMKKIINQSYTDYTAARKKLLLENETKQSNATTNTTMTS